MKGQKLKSLMTELKAHEKAILNLKKRQLPEDEEGGSLKALKSRNLKWIDETVNLEQDLENILSRHHLDPSLAHSHKKAKLESKVVDYADSENHINSVLESSDSDSDRVDKKRVDKKRFDEPRVELLFLKASSLASELFRRYDSESKEGRRRRKDFEEWFMALEQDLVMLDSRLKKQRWLEDESNRLKSVKKTKDDPKAQKPEDNHHSKNHGSNSDGNHGSNSGENHLDSADVQKRLKSLIHKINKSEKELNERISSRKYHEFPTSRTEGEL